MKEDLTRHREAIDDIDRKVVELLNERAAHAIAIGKAKGGAAVYRPEREAQVLSNVAAGAGTLSGESLRTIYREVMSACRALEQSLGVSYLGPEGTFSEMALYKHFGHSVSAVPCASIDEVFRRAETGEVRYAVVPVENSTEGAIARTLDLLLSTSLRICGEVVLRVRQNLLATSDSLDSFKIVYSHAQSLAQCHSWLTQKLPGAERVPVSSNAEAARRAAQEPGTCAIGPELAAERYGLKLLSKGIEDDPRNMTRFLVLGNIETGRSGHDRTSLAITAHNRPGAVHELISPFAVHGVSMTRIESRPARTGQWEYYFYIDLEGHQSDGALQAALAEVTSRAPFIKIFGSYPAATN